MMTLWQWLITAGVAFIGVAILIFNAWRASLDRNEKRVRKEIKWDDTGNRIDEIQKTLNDVVAGLWELGALVKEIGAIVEARTEGKDKQQAAVFERASRTKLTSFGDEIAKNVQAQNIADNLIRQVGKSGFGITDKDTDYDIQEKSLDFARDKMAGHLPPETLGTLKDEAFKRGIKIEIIYRVIGLVLRDTISPPPEKSKAQ